MTASGRPPRQSRNIFDGLGELKFLKNLQKGLLTFTDYSHVKSPEREKGLVRQG